MKHFLYQIAATLGFFTRLPIWRIVNVPKKYYQTVVPYWPLVGWLTGLTLVLTIGLTSFLPVYIAVVLAMVARTLLTGALHEDGFADVCDGFGGGYNRQRILDIMKDSHIGTYGVLGLIFYYALQIGTLTTIVSRFSFFTDLLLVVIVADSLCKFISSTIVIFLPYARNEEEAKNKLIYSPFTKVSFAIGLTFAAIPLVMVYSFAYQSTLIHYCLLSGLCSAVCAGLLFVYFKKKIGGYTGDCCGATFISTEICFYLSFLAQIA